MSSLQYEGCNNFRMRLVLATLSGKSVKINQMRPEEDDPGLKDFEISFIRLLDKVTNGTKTVINETGTQIIYRPGLLLGGGIDHDCHVARPIGYYLEMLMCLAPFTKEPLRAVLRGVTCDKDDPSVDLLKLSVFPVLKRFLGTDEGLELKISKRGAAPDGGGEVLFCCPCRQKLRPVKFLQPGKIKRIRGVAWSVRVSPAFVNRLVDSTRSVLNKFLTDVYIYTDHMKGNQSGKSPGFGLTLVAETTEGAFLAAEEVSNARKSGEGPSIPEDIGKKAAVSLLQEIHRGGCVGSMAQSLAALMMVLGQQDVSKVQMGELTPYTIQFLRHIRDFFQVTFSIKKDQKPVAPSTDDEEEPQELRVGADKLILTCVGVGYSNVSKAVR
ncbi:RNA 3'-terminal phosphate cyclase-like protein [Aplysia californica]|uniref:RNA 3'-terminal phosphate cyclase-like protein n=1 Tax=Aplysia californica TaxID=6500 RepID=A0ABM0K6N9_APLCA|nr:RNA 3'-terminal phosphate cyclase-like protein [Aplysia californica]